MWLCIAYLEPMDSRELLKGENASVDEVFGEKSPSILVTIETAAESATVIPDASVLVVGSDGKVRSNDDFVFYNQPVGLDGALQLVDSSDTDAPDGVRRDVIRVDLARLPESATRIVIAASADATSEPLGGASMLRMWVARAAESGRSLMHHKVDGLTVERALIFGEIYRREDRWRIRAVGQGYAGGLVALVTDFGVVVDDDDVPESESAAVPDLSEAPGERGEASAQDSRDPDSDATAPEPSAGVDSERIAISRRRRPLRLPRDWSERKSPYCPPRSGDEQWSRARLFPAVGMKTTAEQEGRATSVLLSVVEIVREFGRMVVTRLGAPGGKIETFTEVRFSNAGVDVRPDGLIRVRRAGREWTALVEVKTAKATISSEQMEAYLKVANAKGFDAVITISRDLGASADELPYTVDARVRRSVDLYHLSWEEIIADAAITLQHTTVEDRSRRRILEEFLWYACEVQSGMWTFDDMGRHWVKVRESVKNRTIGASDTSTQEICLRFDQLSRHIALQLSVLTGQRVTAQPPPDRSDTVSRAKQLADSGELFANLRVTGAAGPVVINANLARERIGCSIKTPAPRRGRTGTKISWLIRHVADTADNVRVTAHHAGSRTETTSALLSEIRADPTVIMPADGKDIREFTVTSESSMGSKRAGSEGGFVTAMVKLTNNFYVEVVESLRSGRDS